MDIEIINTKGRRAKKLVLDTRDLDISKVMLVAPNKKPKRLCFELGERDDILGSPLTIKIPHIRANRPATIKIYYKTSPQAFRVQWLEPQQTAGKIHPYLFTQSQVIHARSWIPLQDTPQVRTTYTATIRTPDELRVVMSASNELYPTINGVFNFEFFNILGGLV